MAPRDFELVLSLILVFILFQGPATRTCMLLRNLSNSAICDATLFHGCKINDNHCFSHECAFMKCDESKMIVFHFTLYWIIFDAHKCVKSSSTFTGKFSKQNSCFNFLSHFCLTFRRLISQQFRPEDTRECGIRM